LWHNYFRYFKINHGILKGMINFLYRKYGERERGKMDVWFKIMTTCRALDYRLRHDLLEYLR